MAARNGAPQAVDSLKAAKNLSLWLRLLKGPPGAPEVEVPASPWRLARFLLKRSLMPDQALHG